MLPVPHRGRFQRVSAPPPLPDASAPQAVYEEEPPEVARVVIRVEYTDGRACEVEAREPQGFRLEDGMAVRRTGLSVASGDGFAPVSHAVGKVRLEFTAHPRHNVHTRTHGPWKILSEEAHGFLAAFLSAMGY